MRKFSEIEKKAMAIIAAQDYTTLSAQDTVSLIALLLNQEYGIKLEVIPLSDDPVAVYIDQPEKIFIALDLISSGITLIKYLEDNYYILTHEGYGNKVGDLMVADNEQYIRNSLKSSKTLFHYILDNWKTQIYATEALKKMVDSNFKSPDDIVFEKQLYAASSQIKWVKITLMATLVIQLLFNDRFYDFIDWLSEIFVFH